MNSRDIAPRVLLLALTAVLVAACGKGEGTAPADAGPTSTTNEPPQVALKRAPPAEVSAGDTLVWEFLVTDPENDAVTGNVPNLPENATYSPQPPMVTWTPSTAQAGPVSFTFTATDAAGNASDFPVSVNVAPFRRMAAGGAVVTLGESSNGALLALGPGFGARSSTDQGRTFSSGSSLTTNARFLATLGGAVYVADKFKVFRSTDELATVDALKRDWIADIVGLAARGTAVMVATSTQGMYRSTDAGASWAKATLVEQSLAGAAANADAVWAWTGKKLYASTTDGATWTKVSEAAPDPIVQLAFSTIEPKTLFVLTAKAVLRSDDGGQTMTAVRSEPAQAVFVHPASPDRVFIADAHGVYLSADRGATFTLIGGKDVLNAPGALFMSSKETASVYVGTASGLFKAFL